MATTHKNRVQMTVTGTPGTGTITLNAASSGYQTFGSAHGANATVDCLFTDGTAWEVARDCTYTHSGTTLSRGTLESSSTGSAISLTSMAVVSQILTADRGRQFMAAALEHSTVTGTSGAISAAVNTLYVADMSGWTADRTLTLPATAAVGDRVGVMVSVGDADYEWLITAASGDTLNAVAGGTEWSRVFITGEVVVMRCVVANTTWVVEQDGRIPQQGLMRLSTSASAETTATFVQPTSFSGAWTADTDVGGVCTTSTGRITTRRAGKFSLACFGFSVSALGAGKYFSVALYKSGTTNILFASTLGTPSGTTVGQQAGGHAEAAPLAADDYVVYQYRSEEGSKGLTSSALPRVISWFSMVEVLS